MVEISVLLDYYKPLLTEKQKKYIVDYFEEDLSLSEIAQKYEVTRQAVFDNIKRVSTLLREYENKLNFRKKDRVLYNELLKIKKTIENENFEKAEEELNDIIEKMS